MSPLNLSLLFAYCAWVVSINSHTSVVYYADFNIVGFINYINIYVYSWGRKYFQSNLQL